MPEVRAIKRRDLVRNLTRLGFEGPYSGGRHQFMLRGDRTVRLPNPHESDISASFLLRILRQAGVERTEWESL